MDRLRHTRLRTRRRSFITYSLKSEQSATVFHEAGREVLDDICNLQHYLQLWSASCGEFTFDEEANSFSRLVHAGSSGHSVLSSYHATPDEISNMVHGKK